MTVPGNINALLLGGQRGYQIERSLRFNSADSAYCSRAGWTGNQQLQTFSLWVKRTAFGSRQTLFGGTNSSGLYGLYFEFDANDALLIGDYSTSWAWQLNTTARYRDPSAWYHIVFAVDTANATASNRAKLYVNGVQVTAFSTANYMSQNYNMYWGYVSYVLAIGRLGENNSQYFNGYMTDVYFIDGQALTPSSFGETDTITGVWKPKKYAGTYGTNGFYLKFADNSATTSTTLGKDSSGNGNNWTPNNFSVTAGAGNDSLIDTPTPYADGGNGRGNYCTLNPLKAHSSITLTNGNLNAVRASGSWVTSFATIGITSGKWYWEGTCTRSISDEALLGIAQAPATLSGYAGVDSYGWGYYTSATQSYKINNGSAVLYGATYTNGDVIGVALDLSAGTLTFYKNGTSQGTAYSSLSGEFFPTSSCVQGSAWVMNFGQRPFAYTPPSGFLALNTQNLPEPSIKKPSSYMNTLLYTGNGGTQTITGLNFQSDFIWIKERSANVGGTGSHRLYDSQRGPFGYWLSSNSTAAETASGTLGLVDSTGFTLGTDNDINDSGASYVAWCWDESATPGFDIVTYTGTGANTTVAHGLGVQPQFLIIKCRDTAADPSWIVSHTSIGLGSGRLILNGTDSNTTAGAATLWNSTAPTSSVFSLGNYSSVNGSGLRYVAYLWSEVAGFSKFGSYTGNGSADGPFVFCGFRPRWVILKRTDSLGAWDIHDAARDPDNVVDQLLEAQNSNAEASYSAYSLDFVSNGFKLRGNGASQNASGGTFVFAAFAESPFKYSLAR